MMKSLRRISHPQWAASVALCGLMAVSGAFAQPREDHSHFEVASIRPVDHRVRLHYMGPNTGDLGRISWSRISLRQLIAAAYPEYGVFGQRISGPRWIENEYAVAATIPPGSTIEEIVQMFQNLVAERFGLKFHDMENKEAPGFELTIGPSGFKLTPSTAKEESTPPSTGALVAPPRETREIRF